MTVKELIEKLKEFDENLEVGSSGHFGELLPIEDVEVQTETGEPDFVNIRTRYAGPEPD